jgi:hypothetical protein
MAPATLQKKVSGFPIPSRDVTNQTLPGREYFARESLVTPRLGRLGMGNSLTFFTVYSVAKIPLLSWGSGLVLRTLNVPFLREIILETAPSSSMFFVPLINAIVLYLTYKYFRHRRVLEQQATILIFFATLSISMFFCIHQPEYCQNN